MKQFRTILKFELKNYFTNKIFVGVTLFLVAAIMIVMYFPRLTSMFDKTEDPSTDVEELPVMLVAGEGAMFAKELFSKSFTGYDVQHSERSLEEIQAQITSGEVKCAFVLNNLTSYTYYVNNLSMYDSNTAIADEVLQSVYRMSAMIEGGMSAEAAQQVMSVQIQHEVTNLGVDQVQNYFYTYFMIMALYMVILLYGQMVATNVATEKSSRAMEVLVTSVAPTSMMFGKVFASCIAGLTQLIAVFGSSVLFHQLNREYWGDNPIVQSIFDMPIDLLLYMLLFFVLGFLVYAFLYGAIGSTASKLEDINTSVMPLTMLFLVGFFVVIFSMTAGDVDNTLMRICSYIPFTSPIAMFTRIAMSVVPIYEIIISVLVLVASVIGIGIVSAKIYRVGVLLYGTPPKLSAIFKAIRRS